MERSDILCRSEAMEVHFAGFRSDTVTLQRTGWRLAVEEDIIRNTLRLMMHHDQAGLYLVADEVRYDYMSRGRLGIREERPVFLVRKVARALQSISSNFDFAKFSPVDAEPCVANVQYKRIEDFALFGAPLVRTEEIIIEPQSVAECLDLIRKMQAPELAEVRRRNLARDRDQPMAQQQFHAQILSLAA